MDNPESTRAQLEIAIQVPCVHRFAGNSGSVCSRAVDFESLSKTYRFSNFPTNIAGLTFPE